MKNYLLTIILVSIFIGICEIIAPRFGGIEKYTKMIGLLIILCVIIDPLADTVKSINEGFFDDIKDGILGDKDDLNEDYDQILNDYLNNFSIEELRKQIKEILKEQFAIPDNESQVSVETAVDNGQIGIINIQILLSGKSIFQNPYKIERYFGELLKCECRVLIKQS